MTLGKRLSDCVLVVTPALTDNERRLVAGLAGVLDPEGIRTLVTLHDATGEGLPDQVKRLLTHQQPRAVVLLGGFLSADRAEALALARAGGVPVVVVNDSAAGLPSVNTDNAAAIRLAVAHLVDDCGARRIAFARGPWHDHDATIRELAFRHEVARHGLEFDEELVFEGGYQLEQARASFRDLLAGDVAIDAVVAANDLSAAGVMAAALYHGLRIPADLKVVGFDDIALASQSVPTLTTVNAKRNCQGAEAGKLLLRLMSQGERHPGEVEPEQVVVTPALSVRSSTTGPTELEPDAVARFVHTSLSAGAALLSVNRAMLRCESFADVTAELAARVGRLGIRNLALVLVDGSPTAPDAEPGARVLLLVRDGAPVAAPGGDFPASEVVPDDLAPQLGATLSVLHPLTVPEGEIGYLLYEVPAEDAVFADALAVDLSRGLASVLSRARIAAHAAALEAVVDRRTEELQRANASLRIVNAGLKRSLLLDSLTGIANRRAFQQHLQQHWHEPANHGRPMSLLMVDVDLFKAFNDYYGHLAGDETLRAIAVCLRESVRGSDDLAARYGGEEFAVVLPGADQDVARAVARRFAARLADRAILHQASPISPFVTASIGAATARVSEFATWGHLLAAADGALYEAKARGRNRVRVVVVESSDGPDLDGGDE